MKSNIGIVATELFQVSLVAYLILLLLESISPGFVSDFFNLSFLLWAVILSGIVMVLPFSEKKWKSEVSMLEFLLHSAFASWDKGAAKKSRFEWMFVFVVRYTCGLLVYYKTSELGAVSIILSFVTGIIIWLLSNVILDEEGE